MMGSIPLLVLCFSFTLIAAMAATASDNNTISGSRPSEISIGALFTFDSTIGRAAKPAIELAVDDVNKNSSVLAGTRLRLFTQDTNCSGFLGTIEGNRH